MPTEATGDEPPPQANPDTPPSAEFVGQVASALVLLAQLAGRKECYHVVIVPDGDDPTYTTYGTVTEAVEALRAAAGLSAAVFVFSGIACHFDESPLRITTPDGVYVLEPTEPLRVSDPRGRFGKRPPPKPSAVVVETEDEDAGDGFNIEGDDPL